MDRAVSIIEGVQCIKTLTQYTILVDCSTENEERLLLWCQKLKITAVNITNTSLLEQKGVFETVRLMPSEYLLYSTEDKHKRPILYKRLYSLIILNVNDNLSKPTMLKLHKDIDSILLVTSIKTYIYDLIIQLRYNRFIHRGVPTFLLAMINDYVKYLALRDDINYVLPQTVQLAFKDIVPFQIRDLLIRSSAEELTMLYGSDIKLIDQVRGIIDETDVMRIVLQKVPVI